MPSTPRAAILLATVLTLSAAVLTGCADESATTTASSKDLSDVEIPKTVDPDTEITVGSPEIQVALKLSGQIDKLPFKVKWANLSGGPQCSEAFRANSLDVCSAAEIPSIHAHWTGLDTKLVAAAFRTDPIKNPIYELGIAPGAGIDSLADLRGKRIAYSPGAGAGRARAAHPGHGRAHQGRRGSWSSCPAPATSIRPRSAAVRSTRRRSAG